MSKIVLSHGLELFPHLSERKTRRSARSFKMLVKTLFDMTLAAIAVFLLAPLMLGIAACVIGADGGPALFRQKRVGKNGKPFICLKFRSMVVDADAALVEHFAKHPEAAREWRDSQKLNADPRVTRLGAFLRKTSLDELPQLLNILGGEMSFVGPRPIVPDEIDRYGERFAHCFSVPPGLTGLWQVSGRSDCSYAHRVALDSRYVSDWRLLGDLEILLLTVPAVLKQRGSC